MKTDTQNKRIYEFCKKIPKEFKFKIKKRISYSYGNKKVITRELKNKILKIVILPSDISEKVLCYVDRLDSWRKLSTCAIILRLPENEDEFDYLICQLKFLSTDLGYEFSQDYNNILDYNQNIPK